MFVFDKGAVHERDGNQCGKEEGGTHDQHPKHFKEELIPKPRRVEVNIRFLLLDVDSGPDSANNLRHEHCRQVI